MRCPRADVMVQLYGGGAGVSIDYDVCFGSLADIAAALPDVRFAPESEHH
jgi:hypothetical protein